MTQSPVFENPLRVLCALSWLCLAGSGCSNHSADSALGAQDPSGASGVTVSSPVPNGASSPTTSTAGGVPVAQPVSIGLGEKTREAYCAGNGPPVEVFAPGGATTGSSAACGTGLASHVFQYGLCTCEDATFTGAFSIDALDSSLSATPGTQIAASVGVNDELISTGVLDIHGSLIAASSGLTPITSGGYHIDGNFETNSDLILTGANITFGRDLWVNGDILAVGLASVAGDVHQTPQHSLSGMTIEGQVLKEDFTIAEPCACGQDQLVDIDAIVAAGKADNHNAALGLGDGPNITIGVGAPLDLDCGRFAFEGANFVGYTVLEAHGRTALFIDGDLTITGAFGIDLGSSGELDVFVTGNLLLTGAGDIGSIDRPAALRFYVGGSGDIAITGANRFAASLYAPRSNVLVTGADDIYGSFFVGSYVATGAQQMHYDAAILHSGGDPDCHLAPPACTNDLGCASPRVCQAGRCTDLIEGPD